MSSQAQYKNNENESQNSEQFEFSPKDKKVNLNDLVDRMNQEKKKNRILAVPKQPWQHV